MRLNISRSKNAASYYVIRTVYVNGKEKRETVEKLGPEKERERLNGADPEKWARNYVAELNRKEQEEILQPSSKLGTLRFAKTLLEPPEFELQQIYRALSVVAKEANFIQSANYKL